MKERMYKQEFKPRKIYQVLQAGKIEDKTDAGVSFIGEVILTVLSNIFGELVGVAGEIFKEYIPEEGINDIKNISSEVFDEVLSELKESTQLETKKIDEKTSDSEVKDEIDQMFERRMERIADETSRKVTESTKAYVDRRLREEGDG